MDYGRAHAKRCGHARFGREHAAGAHPEWDESHPIDLVGHSIGGVTARVLQQLLADGAFPGHKTNAAWIRSLTTLSSPHNGDPVVYSLGAVPHSAACEHAAASSGCADRCTREAPTTKREAPPTDRVRLFSAGYFLTVSAHLLAYLDWEWLNGRLDLQLDHWQLSRRCQGSTFHLLRAIAWRASIGQTSDNAAFEV